MHKNNENKIYLATPFHVVNGFRFLTITIQHIHTIFKLVVLGSWSNDADFTLCLRVK